MNGLVLVDKPEGISSAGVIRALKGALGRSKVGHLGTLDPFASGLLVLCLDEATKVARYLLLEDKEYTGTIRLGAATDTLDGTGRRTAEAAVPPIDPVDLQAVARAFEGVHEQVPPMYSALKRDGVPLYKLARRGVDVERAPRRITIERLVLTAAGPDRIDLDLRCSKGTYVRVLAVEVARALGTVGHLERLRRTAVGPFRIQQAWDVARLAVTDRPGWPMVSVRNALAGLQAFAMGGDALDRLRRGQQGGLRALPPGRPGEAAVVVAQGTDDVEALIEAAARGEWRVVRMLRGAPLQG